MGDESKTTSAKKKKSKSSKPKVDKFAQFKTKKKTRLSTKPIDEAKLSIREYEPENKYDIFKIVNEFRRDYYIHVYKSVFRNWFTYAVTGAFLALSSYFLHSNMLSICFPPLIVTVFLLWKVNRYKKINHHFTTNDMEILNQNESLYFSYKSDEARRKNQGVLLAYLKERNYDVDTELEELFDDTDLDSDSEDSIGLPKGDRNNKVVGYLIYSKQKDEMETVSIKELCVDRDYRKRRVATHFVRRACLDLFRKYGYKRVAFQVSSFDVEAGKVCEKKSHIIKKIYCWMAYYFIPGVFDERTAYAIEIEKLNDRFK